MDERLRFVARLLDGEKMAAVCREFGISRKTGYKIFNRYKDEGLRGLEDRARSPYRHPNKLPFQVETAILRIKREHTSWGAPKIREKLAKVYPMVRLPAASTIHAVLDRHGLVRRRKRRRYKAQGTELSHARSPNALWCADYKGQFRLGNRQYCYPLTITDYRSRYLLACEGLESTQEAGAFPVFERAFKDFGLPAAIRTDEHQLTSGEGMFRWSVSSHIAGDRRVHATYIDFDQGSCPSAAVYDINDAHITFDGKVVQNSVISSTGSATTCSPQALTAQGDNRIVWTDSSTGTREIFAVTFSRAEAGSSGFTCSLGRPATAWQAGDAWLLLLAVLLLGVARRYRVR